MKKLISILLAALMLLSAVPLAFAEGDEAVIVDKISVKGADITPTAGRAAGSMRLGSVTVNDGLPVASIGHSYWWDCTNDWSIYDEDIFEEGISYQHVWTIDLDEGYKYADEVEIELNGSTENMDFYGIEDEGHMYFWSVQKIAENDGLLHSVQIKYADAIPVIGAKAGDLKQAFVTADGTDRFTVKSDMWYKVVNSVGEVVMDDEETFSADASYYRSFNIEPSDDMAFSENTWAEINGEDVTCTLSEDGSVHIYSTPAVAVEHIDIDKVVLNDIDPYPVELDTAGDHNVYEFAEGERYSVSGAKWYCADDEAYMADDDTFVAGKNYAFEIVLRADEHYLFTENALLMTYPYISESIDAEKTGRDTEDSAVFHVWTVLTECEKLPEVIDLIELTDVYYPPVLGDKPAEHLGCALPEDANYTIYGSYWFDDTTGMKMKENDMFTIGHKYSLGFTVEANDGYVFEKATKATLNGGTDILDVDASGYSRWEPEFYYIWTISYEFAEESTEKLDAASVSDIITQPVIGKTPADISSYTLPEDAHYSVFRVTWYDVQSDEPMENDAVFTEDREYFVEIAIVADVGYTFDENTSLTLNGGTDFDSEYSGYINDKVVRIVTFATEAAEAGEHKTGDVNGDDRINTGDAVIILKYAAEMITLDDTQLAAADTNRDGTVNTGDAVLILKYAAGIINEF